MAQKRLFTQRVIQNVLWLQPDRVGLSWESKRCGRMPRENWKKTADVWPRTVHAYTRRKWKESLKGPAFSLVTAWNRIMTLNNALRFLMSKIKDTRFLSMNAMFNLKSRFASQPARTTRYRVGVVHVLLLGQNECTNPKRAADGVKTCTYRAEPREGN